MSFRPERSGVEKPAFSAACTGSTIQNRQSPTSRQILPSRIFPLNQKDFLLSSPSLNLFLPRDRLRRSGKSLEPNQTIAAVLTRKPLKPSTAMLNHPLIQVARKTHIQNAAAITTMYT
jgi:hypothetical protein